MLLKTIRSDGLAHFSYLVGAGGKAAVIDPSRDVDRYLEAAAEAGVRITHVFETHRHEDFVSGASELAARTGAQAWRGRDPRYDVAYARVAEEGACFEFGDVRLTVLHTPGHTDDSIAIVLAHHASGETPLAVFTGDALFFDDVGRTDFYPGQEEEVAGLLFDSLHKKLLPLGDQTRVYPAHGSGSVCGSAIADRPFSTIGEERAHNPRLQLDRQAFIAAKSREHHYKPPYFRRMEEANSAAQPALGELPRPQAMSVDQVDEALQAGAQLLDLRPAQAIAGACIGAAVSIPLEMLASFGGWFLDARRPIVLLLAKTGERDTAVRTLVRIGCEHIVGFLAGGIEAWTTAAKPLSPITGIDVHRLRALRQGAAPPLLLDVRAIGEFEQGHLEGAWHHYVGDIENALPLLPPMQPVVTYCESGKRALVAAAALVRLGRCDVSVCWGSMKAWKAAAYPVVES